MQIYPGSGCLPGSQMATIGNVAYYRTVHEADRRNCRTERRDGELFASGEFHLTHARRIIYGRYCCLNPPVRPRRTIHGRQQCATRFTAAHQMLRGPPGVSRVKFGQRSTLPEQCSQETVDPPMMKRKRFLPRFACYSNARVEISSKPGPWVFKKSSQAAASQISA